MRSVSASSKRYHMSAYIDIKSHNIFTGSLKLVVQTVDDCARLSKPRSRLPDDNDYYLPARDTCIYRMNETQRRNLTYEDGLPIDDVVYQCQRYVQYCCGLDCCIGENVKGRVKWYAPPQYPWEYPSSVASVTIFLTSEMCSISYVIFLWYTVVH
ncbi:hypothetical protein Tcan_02004 [Toxocara canis]|uniref:CX domain-containing protein n=1 Tax=Toxocara canis TaxID=6265 RepID=A0A0B2VP44_TOXCA|nr:hypothetical protein Tcan_02004 [Toxocara canis]